MKRYSTIMSVLLTLALPVAATCAETPKAPEKTAEAAKAPEKSDAKAEAAKVAAEVESVQKTMSKTGHGAMMMGGAAEGGSDVNPSGKVVETMDGGGYTYANLEKDGKKTWVAFPTLETRVGDTLSFKGCMDMQGFQSKSLNRKFDSILFCNGPEVATKTADPLKAKKSPGSAGATTSSQKIKVDKATGANAYTVSEIFAKRGALDGKQVVVKGQVVKISTGIMDKNWIHLQDGTGDEKKKTHDLVVTTQDMADVGDVITISGKVSKDKDFGGGYKYSVIVENGSVKK